MLTTGLFRQPDDGDLLVRVARTLAPGFELVVAGAAPAALDGVEGVTTHGTVSPARIPDLWPGSLCQLALYRDDLNTRRFASPLKVVAAMASGVPLIATDLPTVRTLVEHEHSALLVGPGDTDGVIRAIARLDDDPALARALATHAVEAARELTWERRGEGLLAFVAGL